MTYDSHKEDAFVLHNSKVYEDCTRFKCNSQGIYALTISTCKSEKETKRKREHSHLVSTVKENRKGYTKTQFKRACIARDLYHSVGAPTLENFKKFITMGGIHNCPIRAADVDIAENIFGPDMATLKGKSVCKKPKPVVEDWLELPKEIHIKHMHVELCMDIININKIVFMTAIDRSFRYQSIVLISVTEKIVKLN